MKITKNDLKKFGIIMLDGLFLGTIMYIGMYLLVPEHMWRIYLLAVTSVMAGVIEGNMLSSMGIFKIIDDKELKKDKEVKSDVNEVVENEVED